MFKFKIEILLSINI